jgi:hypothetical protein
MTPRGHGYILSMTVVTATLFFTPVFLFLMAFHRFLLFLDPALCVVVSTLGHLVFIIPVLSLTWYN